MAMERKMRLGQGGMGNSIKMLWIEIRTMHGGVTASAPTTAEFQFVRVIFVADEDLAYTDE